MNAIPHIFRPRMLALCCLTSGLVCFATCAMALDLVTGASNAVPPAFSLAGDPVYKKIAARFATRFPCEHISQMPMDDAISARAWTNYFDSLDTDRVYFLASDITRFSGSLTKLDDDIERGDLAFAQEVFEVFRERVRNRCEYQLKLLDTSFDFSAKESYTWRRKAAAWPADETEWNEMWRTRPKNEYLRKIIGAELMADAQPTNATQPTAVTNITADLKKQVSQFLSVINDSDPEWVLEKYVSSFAHAYDPHSDFMSSSTLDEFDIEMKLSLVGIGALLSPEDGAAKVLRIVPGGPADLDPEKRLKQGDNIIAVGDDESQQTDIRHWPLRKIVKMIRGQKGTTVYLTVIPASDPTETTSIVIDLVRDEVKLEEQSAKWESRTMPDSSGVVRNLAVVSLPTFYANMKPVSKDDNDYKSCANDMKRILSEIQTSRVDGVLLDLRNNGGGVLSEVVRMTGLFIPSGPVVQVKEQGYGVRTLDDDDEDMQYGGPLVVAVNRLSASASEILAAALQDYGRAIIVGDSKTHGKGTVQGILDLARDPKFGAMKITNGGYYRISGASTQLRGVVPDIVIHSAMDFMDFGEESLPYPMHFNDIESAKYTPDQATAAIAGKLRRLSERRRAADPRFAAYSNLLAQISSLNSSSDVPLDLESRKALAETERKLLDVQRDILPYEPSSTNDTGIPKNDLVLEEALRILSDYTSMAAHRAPGPEQRVAHSKRSVVDRFVDWIKSRL